MLDGEKENSQEAISEELAETIPGESSTTGNDEKKLQAQLQELQDAKAKAEAEVTRLKELLAPGGEDGYKGLQTKYNKTHEEYKKLSDLHSEVNDLKKYIKILAAQQVALSKQDPETMTPEVQAQHLQIFEEMEKESEKRRQETEIKAKQEEQLKRSDEVWNEAQKFGTYNENDSVAEIYDALIDNKLYKAERMLNKLKASATKEKTMPEPKKETEDEIFERIAKQKGLLKSDTVIPSGRASSFEEAEGRFAKGEMTFADYQEARKKAGVF